MERPTKRLEEAMIITLLIIIAIGVLLISRVGRSMLGATFFGLAVGAILLILAWNLIP